MSKSAATILVAAILALPPTSIAAYRLLMNAQQVAEIVRHNHMMRDLESEREILQAMIDEANEQVARLEDVVPKWKELADLSDLPFAELRSDVEQGAIQLGQRLDDARAQARQVRRIT